MKHILVIVLLATLAAACGTPKEVAIRESGKQPDDSTKYELIVSETGFRTWFLTRSKPLNYFSESYYEKWNEEYVRVWNSKVYNPQSSDFFSDPIMYDMDTDYNIELDHELYYYFRYVEEELGHEILTYGPQKPVP